MVQFWICIENGDKNFADVQGVGFESKRSIKGYSKGFGPRIWRMKLPFTKTEKFWKEIIFETDMSIKVVPWCLWEIQVDNWISKYGVWVSYLARDIHLPAYYGI